MPRRKSLAENHISLSEALQTNRLEMFIAQEEAKGRSPADVQEVFLAIDTLVKAPRSKDQTSRSSSRDGSSGKRTR